MQSSLVTYSYFCNRHVHLLVHRSLARDLLWRFLRYPMQRPISKGEQVRDMILIKLNNSTHNTKYIYTSTKVKRYLIYFITIFVIEN